jgi:glycerate 2-kinase
VIPRTVLIASGPFDELTARRVASAIGRGLQERGWPTDACPIVPGDPPGVSRELLDALDFDTRMRRARAVVLAEARLVELATPAGLIFEVATRARQAGVPAYAVTAENRLGAFDARLLDLQVILEASSARTLAAAGRRLGGMV